MGVYNDLLMRLPRKLISLIIPLLLLGLVLAAYIRNIPLEIYSGDIGDLVSASCLRGVAHPPGYPLFVMIGGLLCRAPLSLPPVSKVALLSVISSTIGLVLYYFFSLRETQSKVIASISTLTLAFSYLFWLHAEVPEVFGMNNFFAIAILSCAIFFRRTKKLTYLYCLFFLCLLAFTHHQTIVFLYPGVFIFLFGSLRSILTQKRVLIRLLALGAMSALPYWYIFVASKYNPPVNWDSVHDFRTFVHLLLRKDYGGFAPSVANGIPINVKGIVVLEYFKTLLSTFSFQILSVAILGALYLFRKEKRFFAALLISFILTGPFFIFYSTTIITSVAAWGVLERFYVLSTVVFMFFVPYGLLSLDRFLKAFVPTLYFRRILLGYFFIVPFFLFLSNQPRNNLSTTQIGKNLAMDFLGPLPKNSVIFVTGDTTTFNIWYERFVIGERSDIDIINPGGVGSNVYLNREVNTYFDAHKEASLSAVVHQTIEDIRLRRRLFSTYDLPFKPEGTRLVPWGLVMELLSEKDIPSKKEYVDLVDKILNSYHPAYREKLKLNEKNLVTEEIPMIYANAYVRVGDFMDSYYKDSRLALGYYQKSLQIDPQNPSSLTGVGLATYKALGDCQKGIEYLGRAIEIYPIWRMYYIQQYLVSKQCKDAQTLKHLSQEYKIRFNEDIEDIASRTSPAKP